MRVGGTAAPGRALENALQGQVLVRVRGERGVRAAPGANRVVVQSDTVPRPTALLYWCHHCRALPPGVDVVKLFCACVFAQQPAWTTASAAGPGNRRPAPCHPCVATRHYDRHPVQLQQLRQPHQWRGDPGGTAATDGVVVQGPCYRQCYVSYVVNVCRCPSGPPPASRLRHRRYQPQHHLYRRLCQ